MGTRAFSFLQPVELLDFYNVSVSIGAKGLGCHLESGTGIFLTAVSDIRVTCEDDNECLDPGSCPDPNSWCNNTIGGYNCYCNQAFFDVNGDGLNCTDVNECSDISMNACEEHSFCVDVSAYVETPDSDTLSGLELRLDGGGTRGILETDKLIGYECHCYNYWAQNLDGSLRENPPGSSNNIRIGWDGEITYGEAATSTVRA